MESNPPSPTELLPLTPVTFQMLISLVDGEKHGYAIRKAVEEDTNGAIKIRIGSLYSLVKRLMDAKLIEESDKRPAPELDDERRRYYRLTSFGNKVLSAETQRIKSLMVLLKSKNIGGGNP